MRLWNAGKGVEAFQATLSAALRVTVTQMPPGSPGRVGRWTATVFGQPLGATFASATEAQRVAIESARHHLEKASEKLRKAENLIDRKKNTP